MNDLTERMHDDVEALGTALGFQVRREVGGMFAPVLEDPRGDLMWSLPLTAKQARAIALVTGHAVEALEHIPIVGIEVEGTTPSTKGLAADIANIAALGTRLGLLVVSEAGQKGIYRRAARAVRTARRSFGDLVVLPMDDSWLRELATRAWPSGSSPIPTTETKRPAGGESLAWSASARTFLRALGKDAGFEIAEPYVPDVLRATFEAERARRAKPHAYVHDPIARTHAESKRYGDYLTESEIDLAWLLPLPRGLRALLEEAAKYDPFLTDCGVYPELHGHVAVVGFELESNTRKAAAGGLLNLSAYCVLGVGVSPNEARGKDLRRVLARYRPTFGLRNLHVLPLSSRQIALAAQSPPARADAAGASLSFRDQ